MYILQKSNTTFLVRSLRPGSKIYLIEDNGYPHSHKKSVLVGKVVGHVKREAATEAMFIFTDNRFADSKERVDIIYDGSKVKAGSPTLFQTISITKTLQDLLRTLRNIAEEVELKAPRAYA
jgi:hypothetical protein